VQPSPASPYRALNSAQYMDFYVPDEKNQDAR